MQEAMKVTDQRYRLGYHLMTKGGWMNDPNGFSWFKGYYHMFYQYYPYAAEWGPMHWGHARSKDLVHWETLPVALAPDEHEDGCFSGSAVVYDGKLWLIYTGHHLTNPADSEEFYQDQNIAWSEDGRRLMTAWMNAWDSPMQEKEDGWAGALTIPRELRVEKSRLYQQPVREMASVRSGKLLDGKLAAGSRTALPSTSEAQLTFKEAWNYQGTLLKLGDGQQELTLSFDPKGSRLILCRSTEDGERAAQILPFEELSLQIFVDRSSVEIFVNEGEITFTERMYWQGALSLELRDIPAEKAVIYALEAETNRY